MKLKVGDSVEFKKYEDLSIDEMMFFSKDEFPQFGKVKKIILGLNKKVLYFCIEENSYCFSVKTVARVISDVDDVDSLKKGDEVLVKATIKKVFNGFIQIEPSIGNRNVTKILKRKEPENCIVQENHYGMYIGLTRTLVSDKSKAKLHTSFDAANEAATDMQLDDWDVIPYDD